MPTIIEGQLSASPYRFALVVSRFNEFITRRLVDGALDCLRRHGAEEKAIDIYYCPGAFEIPQTAQLIASQGKHHAVVCLGCIVKGETPHFDYISSAVSGGLSRVATSSPVPILFGVLTTNSLDQAIERAGAKGGNKGWDAALSAIESADLFHKIGSRKK